MASSATRQSPIVMGQPLRDCHVVRQARTPRNDGITVFQHSLRVKLTVVYSSLRSKANEKPSAITREGSAYVKTLKSSAVDLGVVALTNSDILSPHFPAAFVAFDSFHKLDKLDRLFTDRAGHSVGTFAELVGERHFLSHGRKIPLYSMILLFRAFSTLL